MIRRIFQPTVAYVIALAAITAGLAGPAANVAVDLDNEAMNSRDPDSLARYEDFKRTFGNDEDVLVVAGDAAPLGETALRVVADLTSAFEAIDGVASVISIANAQRAVATSHGAEHAPLLEGPPGQASPQALAAALADDTIYDGLLVSADRRLAAIIVRLEERPGDDEFRGRVMAEIRSTMASGGAGTRLRLTGLLAYKHEIARLVSRDRRILVAAAVVLLTTVLWGFGGQAIAVWLPMAVTAVSLVWTYGFYGLAGHALNPITSLLAPVVMVLSIATSVHLYRGWLELVGSVSPAEAARASLRTLFAPCLFTALTTALGLGSLSFSDTPAVRLFGLYAALGVTVSFVVGTTLVPAVLARSRVRGDARDRARFSLGPVLARIAEVSVRRPRTILAATVVATVAVGAGALWIRSDTDLVRFLKHHNPLFKDTLFIDHNLTGIYTLEALVSRRDGATLTAPDDLRRIDAFTREVGKIDGVAAALSIADLIARVHSAEQGLAAPTLPDHEADALYCFDLLEADDSALAAELIDPRLLRARVGVRIRAVGTAQAAAMMQRVRDLRSTALGGAYDLVLTGAFERVVAGSNRIVASQIRTFSVALVLVAAAIAVLLRSARLVLVSLIPNVIPVTLCAGTMGWLRIELSTATAMIASVVIGMAVDDTIHYLARFRREYSGDIAQAIFATTTATGVALTVTSAVLVLGLWVGVFGSFVPTAYFALLSGATMIVALVCDLVVLPACLVLMERGVEVASG